MSLTLHNHVLPPKRHLPQPIKFQTRHLFSLPTPFLNPQNNKPKKTIQTRCATSSTGGGDPDLASDFATEVEKMNTHMANRDEAMKKSREILFSELCQYVGMKAEEVKKKWSNLDEDEKWVLVRGFLSEWSVNFHPLSARSVKEMVDEHLTEDTLASPDSSSSPSLFFPGLKKIMGF